jgi:hypothetical protein
VLKAISMKIQEDANVAPMEKPKASAALRCRLPRQNPDFQNTTAYAIRAKVDGRKNTKKSDLKTGVE